MEQIGLSCRPSVDGGKRALGTFNGDATLGGGILAGEEQHAIETVRPPSAGRRHAIDGQSEPRCCWTTRKSLTENAGEATLSGRSGWGPGDERQDEAERCEEFHVVSCVKERGLLPDLRRSTGPPPRPSLRPLKDVAASCEDGTPIGLRSAGLLLPALSYPG